MIPSCLSRKVSCNLVPRAGRSLVLCKWSLVHSAPCKNCRLTAGCPIFDCSIHVGKNRTSPTLFLHFSTPRWEPWIMFAMSHLMLCGTRIRSHLLSPILSCSFSSLQWESGGLFQRALHFKSYLKSNMAVSSELLTHAFYILR